MENAKTCGAEWRDDASIDLIKKYLDDKTPPIVEVSSAKFFDNKSKHSHAILLIGYDDNGFYYHDPSKNGKKGGFISFERFRNMWEEPQENKVYNFKYERNMYVILRNTS